jgi:hypothetical protein
VKKGETESTKIGEAGRERIKRDREKSEREKI